MRHTETRQAQTCAICGKEIPALEECLVGEGTDFYHESCFEKQVEKGTNKNPKKTV